MSKLFSLIYSGHIRKDLRKKIIPSEEFSSLLSAQELMQKAREDMKIYLKENQKDCQKYLEQAEERGFQKGLTEFNHFVMHFEQKILELRRDMQKQLLPLALGMAKKIVNAELQVHPEVIIDIIRQNLQPVVQHHHIKICVNKEDRPLVESKKQELKKLFEYVTIFIIEEREGILPGECTIETEAGIINAKFENQWQALAAAFEAFEKEQAE